MHPIEKLLEDNKKWAGGMVSLDADFFTNLADIQTPDFLWIGCSDSRVPANEITGTQPGEMFVHRNIANMVVHTDLNLLSVLEYAVVHLKVKHIIVCGHYGCGGVKAAMDTRSYGLINKWLRNIKDVYRFHQDELNGIASEEERVNRLVELNVKEQVMNLAKTSIIQRAWKEENRPSIHGWVYGLTDGILKPIYQVATGAALDPIYQFSKM
jgi:carbonic anhydrase